MSAREKQQWQAMLAQSFEPRDWFINDDAPEEPYRVVYQYRLLQRTVLRRLLRSRRQVGRAEMV